MAKIKVLNISTLSYSGTTWLNLLLGSHPQAFALGPPHRIWDLREEKFETACLVHAKDCSFWPAFGQFWNGNTNIFKALGEYSNKSVFLFDNAPPEFIAEAMEDPEVEVLSGRYVRDGRAITASFARKMKDHGVNYLESILPTGWFYHSFQAIPSLETLKNDGVLVIKYEDVVNDQASFLRKAGEYLGLNYQENTFRFWEHDHHITSGNQGPIAMVRLEQNLPINNFESADVYREQLEKLRANPVEAFKDERWKTQLTREDLFWFDQLMGAKNAELGYERDVFSDDEARTHARAGVANNEFFAALPEDIKKSILAIA